ncbi:MAG: uroporphyrinogen-III C-methyltransferase, partial [Gammaproteobacteria bacterium]
MTTRCNGKSGGQQPVGCVRLVGAGPGDPGLLTVRALECLQQADVIVYDRLVSDAVLAETPPGVPKIYAGKAPGQHHMEQHEINRRIVNLARAGHCVVRLKGGDPFVFGRGAEEAQYLSQHGVPFEIVPGITAASACAAYSGIPLTHRSLSQGVQLVAGHCRADEPLDLDWRTLSDPSFTVVIY